MDPLDEFFGEAEGEAEESGEDQDDILMEEEDDDEAALESGELGDDVLDDHFLGGVNIATARKRATLAARRRNKATSDSAMKYLLGRDEAGAGAGGSSSSTTAAKHLPSSRGAGVAAGEKRARCGGLNIAGGYVQKGVMDTPLMKTLVNRANAEYLAGDYGACKGTIKEIAEEMGGGLVSRDVHMLLANVHEKEGNIENSLIVKYFCLVRLGGMNLADYKMLIAAFLSTPGLREKRRTEVITLCRRCVAARFADEEVYTTLGQLYEEEGDWHSACNAGYLRAFSLRFGRSDPKLTVDAVAQDAARLLFALKRWDDCCEILEMAAQRSEEVTSRISDSILLLFGEVLCLHLRDFRRCVTLYFRAWGLARTGDAQRDALLLGPAHVIRRVFGQKDLERLSWFAVALIELGRWDEVDETAQFHRGSAEAESALCVCAVYSIVDRTSLDDVAGESILHNIVDALLGKNLTEPARRLLQKFEVAKKLSAKTRYRLGQCAYAEKDYKTALKHLEALLEMDDRDADIEEQALRVQLAEIYVLTKNPERFSRVLTSDLTYENLKRLKRLPSAMSRGDREQSFRDLRAALHQAWLAKQEHQARKDKEQRARIAASEAAALVSGASTATGSKQNAAASKNAAALTSGNRKPAQKSDDKQKKRSSTPKKREDHLSEAVKEAGDDHDEEEELPAVALPPWFLARFVYLVHDCELDHDRASAAAFDEDDDENAPSWRQKKRSKMAKQTEGEDGSNVPARRRRRVLTVPERKRALALEGVEDIFGPALWLEFVRFGCEFGVAEVCQRPEVGVEILETVIYNRRTFVSRNKQVQDCVPRLERTSLVLALQANMSKIAFRHLRNLAIRDGKVDERAVALLGRLLASSGMSFESRREVARTTPAAGQGSTGAAPGSKNKQNGGKGSRNTASSSGLAMAMGESDEEDADVHSSDSGYGGAASKLKKRGRSQIKSGSTSNSTAAQGGKNKNRASASAPAKTPASRAKAKGKATPKKKPTAAAVKKRAAKVDDSDDAEDSDVKLTSAKNTKGKATSSRNRGGAKKNNAGAVEASPDDDDNEDDEDNAAGRAATSKGTNGATTSIRSGEHRPRTATVSANISDYQKWASRHLCAHPESWGLMMLVGHCSCMSGRSRFAAKEYARAIAQCPENALSHLCYGANLLTMAMSRTTNRRHAEVCRGLLALRRYQDLRKKTHESETWYNIGRAHHLLGLFKFAVSCYFKCLEKLEQHGALDEAARSWTLSTSSTTDSTTTTSTRPGFAGGASAVDVATASTSSHRNNTTGGATAAASSSSKTQQVSATTAPSQGLDGEDRVDLLALQRACAHNLQLLLAHAGNLEEAKAVAEKYMVIV
ncbi:unnamed protein product [Amoebophrya sp. A25]|nr:unnamed protein product [Amoebophrya sp. A25]|eukprot:GSA25T00000708001.1